MSTQTKRPGVESDPSLGPSIITFTGRKFYFNHPSKSEVVIEDIAHSLANTCRFAGHCREFYSVAQHSVLVSKVVQERCPQKDRNLFGRTALLHDAHEAYVGDVISPLKLLRPDNAYLDNAIQMKICDLFRCMWPDPGIVKDIDLLMLNTEQRALCAGHQALKESEYIKLAPNFIEPWPPILAEKAFLQTFEMLKADDSGTN